MTGKIIKGIAGFYYVHIEGCGVYECKAKGVFRNKSIKPLVGDNVEIDIVDEAEMKGNISTVLERNNDLIRPAVANVDQALVLFALKDPSPNLNLLDRFLVMMEFQNIGTVICFNKSDISTDEEANKLSEIYTQAGYKVIVASVEKGEGVEKVKNQLHGKTTVFAGPSGVGKSSMLNALASDYKMETGEVSKKIGRGKHTTRHSEIFYIDKETYVIDTPGFTSLDVPGMDERVLEECFPEFISSIGKCKFTGCAHMSEPDCEIKRLVEEGSISAGRYENYKSFYEELKNRKKY